eukprot:TRINITY_DN51024_c0_g1_i1.p1 TRINITY_DN51024_c0_g1~~TRINITY_DN51024_c0_g1_i1.p1  ORF type:complete len:135 (+),score=34.41 TRINITY_DN51024_c0_g1_i1:105-509(+)
MCIRDRTRKRAKPTHSKEEVESPKLNGTNLLVSTPPAAVNPKLKIDLPSPTASGDWKTPWFQRAGNNACDIPITPVSVLPPKGNTLQKAILQEGPKALEQLMQIVAVSYTHLRAHETPEHLVCRLLLEKKKTKK